VTQAAPGPVLVRNEPWGAAREGTAAPLPVHPYRAIAASRYARLAVPSMMGSLVE